MNFAERVYSMCKKIPIGKITTYGAIAEALHSSPRAVGQALRCNPYAPLVPCHRVIKSDGTIGGFNGRIKGAEIRRKILLLKKEGISISKNSVLNLGQVLVRDF